tara:strand:+ start:275 stop:898 length:624 start_codon:yes stop_codon:yes gene_type:complete
MKKLSLLLIAVCTCASSYGQADNSATINIKGGLNLSGIKDEPNGVSTNNMLGYNAGLDVRLGENLFFLQPGAYFYQYNQEYTIVDFSDPTEAKATGDIKVQSIKVPVLLGARVVSSDALTIRINAGPAFNFPVDVTSSNEGFQIQRKNYNSANVGGVLGAGVDLAFFTFDLNYEFGLSEYIDFSKSPDFTSGSSEQFVISLNVGVKF